MTERLPPEFLGMYQLRELLGRGGMGLVYRALSTANGKDVAVKFMAGELFEGDDAEARFMAEARAVEGLQHPHLVTVIDCGKAGTTPFIVFEYVAGETLKDRVRRDGRLSAPEALDVVEGVLEGLKAAHARKVIHRDIKAENILLDKQSGRPKVADFGIAKSDRPQQTKTGVIMGTPAYMAPEQASGQKLDARADIYSVGIVLFEMLTGQLPFGDENSMAVMMAHLNESVPAPSYLVEGLPHLLDDLVAGALAKKPEDRYPSAGAFLIAAKRTRERLEKVGYKDTAAPAQDGSTKAVHLASASSQAVELAGIEPTSRTRAAAAVPGGAGKTAVTGGTQARTLANAGPSIAASMVQAKATPPPRRTGLLAAGVGVAAVLVGVAGWMASRGGEEGPSLDETLARAEKVRGFLEQISDPETGDTLRLGLLQDLPRSVPAGDGPLAKAVLARLDGVEAILSPGSDQERELLLTRVTLGDYSAYLEAIELAGASQGEQSIRTFEALAGGLERGDRPSAEQVDELARELWAVEPSRVAQAGLITAFYRAAGALGGEWIVEKLGERLAPGRRDDLPPATQKAMLAALQAVAAADADATSAERARELLAEGAKGRAIEVQRSHEALDSAFHGTREVSGS